MIDLLVFIIGGVVGILVSLMLVLVGDNDRQNEAYHLGYQDGFADAMHKMGDRYDGYKFPEEGKHR